MNRKTICIILIMMFLAIDGWGQKSNRQLVRDDKTNLLYFETNGKKTLVDEGVITVKLKPGTIPFLENLKIIQSNRLGYADLEVPVGMMVEDYVNILRKSNAFDGIYYNSYLAVQLHPQDQYFPNQNDDYYHDINLEDAWEFSTGNPSIKVAVIDSKVDFGHPDLGMGTGTNGYTNLLQPTGWTFGSAVSPGQHGTMVAGIIGAKTNNSIGIAGIAGGNHSHGVTVIPYNLSNIGPTGNVYLSTFNLDDAIVHATDIGAKVINMSLGISTANVGDYPFIDDAIANAYSQGVVLVAGTGNDNSSSVDYPANHPKVIAVGAGTTSTGRSYFSNYGNDIEIVAPGVSIISTGITSWEIQYPQGDGTSFSAPIVSGVIALMFSVNPSLTPNRVREILRQTATKYSGYSYNGSGWCSQIGYGVINARAALSLTSISSISGPKVVSGPAVFSIDNLSQDFSVSWSLTDSYYNQYCLEQNTPSINKCTITPDNTNDMSNKTLTAVIRKNNVIVKVLTKTGIYAQNGFKGHFTSGSLSGDIHYSLYFNIKANTATTVTSPNFYGATVTYSSSGATPTAWGFNSTNGVLNFKAPAGSAPVIINVHDVCGNNYVLYAMPSSYGINVSNGDNDITVTLVEDGDASKDFTPEESWTVEVINAETGRVMATQSSMNRSETISTAGWPKGIYIVKVTIGKEELTEKVMVK